MPEAGRIGFMPAVWRRGALLAAMLCAACGVSLQPISSLQGQRIALRTPDVSALQPALEAEAARQGARLIAATAAADLRLHIEREHCENTPVFISGTSARASSYELRCTVHYTLALPEAEAISKTLTVQDVFLYDSGSVTAAEFPGRANEKDWLHTALAAEAALDILLHAAAILTAVGGS